MMEYTGGGFQYLTVIAIDSDQAIVATLTVPPPRFDDIRDETLPYFLTLNVDDVS